MREGLVSKNVWYLQVGRGRDKGGSPGQGPREAGPAAGAGAGQNPGRGSPFSHLLWLRARWKQQGSIFANWGKAANKEQVKERKREKRIWKKNRVKEGRGSLEGGRRQGEGPALAGGGAGGGADPAPPRNLPKAP